MLSAAHTRKQEHHKACCSDCCGLAVPMRACQSQSNISGHPRACCRELGSCTKAAEGQLSDTTCGPALVSALDRCMSLTTALLCVPNRQVGGFTVVFSSWTAAGSDGDGQAKENQVR
jgi:hypothetical protein